MDGSSMLKPASLAPQDALPLTLPRPGVDKATNEQAARMFEGLMMTQMFQAMRKTIQPSGLFGNESQSRATYEYMLDQAVVEHVMSSGKGWGLAEHLEKNWADSQKSASTLS
jgi:Rod binding domain-containing protein